MTVFNLGVGGLLFFYHLQGMARTVKVAIIGSGLAGLTAAYLLAQASETETEVEFEVHVFEKVRVVNPVLIVVTLNAFFSFSLRLWAWTRPPSHFPSLTQRRSGE